MGLVGAEVTLLLTTLAAEATLVVLEVGKTQVRFGSVCVSQEEVAHESRVVDVDEIGRDEHVAPEIAAAAEANECIRGRPCVLELIGYRLVSAGEQIVDRLYASPECPECPVCPGCG